MRNLPRQGVACLVRRGGTHRRGRSPGAGSSAQEGGIWRTIFLRSRFMVTMHLLSEDAVLPAETLPLGHAERQTSLVERRKR
jgi:hypothetical protein